MRLVLLLLLFTTYLSGQDTIRERWLKPDTSKLSLYTNGSKFSIRVVDTSFMETYVIIYGPYIDKSTTLQKFLRRDTTTYYCEEQKDSAEYVVYKKYPIKDTLTCKDWTVETEVFWRQLDSVNVKVLVWTGTGFLQTDVVKYTKTKRYYNEMWNSYNNYPTYTLYYEPKNKKIIKNGYVIKELE